MIPPKAEEQIDSIREELLRAHMAASSAKYDSAVKCVRAKVDPSEFDYECRW